MVSARVVVVVVVVAEREREREGEKEIARKDITKQKERVPLSNPKHKCHIAFSTKESARSTFLLGTASMTVPTPAARL